MFWRKKKKSSEPQEPYAQPYPSDNPPYTPQRVVTSLNIKVDYKIERLLPYAQVKIHVITYVNSIKDDVDKIYLLLDNHFYLPLVKFGLGEYKTELSLSPGNHIVSVTAIAGDVSNYKTLEIYVPNTHSLDPRLYTQIEVDELRIDLETLSDNDVPVDVDEVKVIINGSDVVTMNRLRQGYYRGYYKLTGTTRYKLTCTIKYLGKDYNIEKVIEYSPSDLKINVHGDKRKILVRITKGEDFRLDPDRLTVEVDGRTVNPLKIMAGVYEVNALPGKRQVTVSAEWLGKKVNKAEIVEVRGEVKIDELSPTIFEGVTIYGVNIHKLIGEGAYGLVYFGTYNGESVAVKIFLPRKEEDLKAISLITLVKQILHEALNLNQFSDIDVVKIKGVFINNEALKALTGEDLTPIINTPPMILMELMEGIVESLSHEKETVKIVGSKTAYVLSLLHARGYVHTDVKPNNIFLRYKNLSFNSVVLGDLGSTVKIGEPAITYSYYSSLQQMISAASRAAGWNEFGVYPQDDIFSLGMTLYKLLYGELPSYNVNIDDWVMGVYQRLKNVRSVAEYRNAILSTLSEAYQICASRRLKVSIDPLGKLIERMLNCNKVQRPSAYEVYEILRRI